MALLGHAGPFDPAHGVVLTTPTSTARTSTRRRCTPCSRQRCARNHGSASAIPSLNNLALVELETAAYAYAIAHFERALTVQTAAFGAAHPKVAIILSNLGVVRQSLGEYEEAAALHERALEIREDALGPEHPEVAMSLNNPGNARFMMGRDDTKPLFERALAIKTSALGPNHPDTAETVRFRPTSPSAKRSRDRILRAGDAPGPAARRRSHFGAAPDPVPPHVR